MDLSDKTELQFLSTLLTDARDAAPHASFLLVGATARDLLLHYGDGVPITRATKDVDLGIAVGSWDEFHQLRDAWLASSHFAEGRPGHRLIHSSGTPIDLIPFGGVERDDGTIEWPEDSTVMDTVGYAEALASATQVKLPNDTTVATVCLPMLAILKLIAWSERHEKAPGKDASDLFLVLRNYLNDATTARLYEVGTHLLEREDFDYEAAGAWLAGYDAAQCIANYSSRPHHVLEAIRKILNVEADANGSLQLVGETGAMAAVALKLIVGFRDGFFEDLA